MAMKINVFVNRTVSILLTLCLLFSAFPLGALAEGVCTCTDKCSFSVPNGSCAHCSSAEESAFRCAGTYPSGVTAGNLTRTYGSSLEETFSLSVTGGSGQLTVGYNKTHSAAVSGSSVTLRWSDVLPGELDAGTYSLSYTFTPASPDYRASSGTISFRVLPREVAATVQLSQTEYVYDGVPKTPAVTATAEGRTLVEGVDYTVSYHFNNAPGMARVELVDVPGDNDTVSGSAYFSILFAPSNIGAVTYTGPQLLDSMAPGDVVLTRENTAVPGVLTLSAMKLYPQRFRLRERQRHHHPQRCPRLGYGQLHPGAFLPGLRRNRRYRSRTYAALQRQRCHHYRDLLHLRLRAQRYCEAGNEVRCIHRIYGFSHRAPEAYVFRQLGRSPGSEDRISE